VGNTLAVLVPTSSKTEIHVSYNTCNCNKCIIVFSEENHTYCLDTGLIHSVYRMSSYVDFSHVRTTTCL